MCFLQYLKDCNFLFHFLRIHVLKLATLQHHESRIQAIILVTDIRGSKHEKERQPMFVKMRKKIVSWLEQLTVSPRCP